MQRSRNNTNINKLIIQNAKLLQADNKSMKEVLLQIHKSLANDSILDKKEDFLLKIEKSLKL